VRKARADIPGPHQRHRFRNWGNPEACPGLPGDPPFSLGGSRVVRPAPCNGAPRPGPVNRTPPIFRYSKIPTETAAESGKDKRKAEHA